MKASVKHLRDRYIILVTLLLLLVSSVALIYTHPDKKKRVTPPPSSEYENTTITKWHRQLRELIQIKDFVNAELLAKNILRTLPDDIFAKRVLTCCIVAKNDLSGAFDQCSTILLSHPDDALSINNLAILLFASEKTDEAVKNITVARELLPDNPTIRHNYQFIREYQDNRNIFIQPETDTLLLKSNPM